LTDYVNVLIAQSQLLRAQEGVAKVQAERLGAHASLMTALGGGLDDPANGPQQSETLPAHGKGKSGNSGNNGNRAEAGSDAAKADAGADVNAKPGTVATTASRAPNAPAAE
jgi:hypothetical protein